MYGTRGLAMILGAAAVAALLAPTTTAANAMAGQKARLAPPEGAESDARGFFRILGINSAVAQKETLKVKSIRLDATADAEGNLPEYRFHLRNTAGDKSADFGAMDLTPGGNARLLFRSWVDDFPEGVTTLAEFSGGTAEVRLGDVVVLTGTVAEFVRVGRPDDAGPPAGDGGGSAAVRVELAAGAGDADAAGVLLVFQADGTHSSEEGLRLVASGLAEGTYTVVARDSAGTDTALGTFDTTAAGRGFLEVTGTADTMPGGGLANLAGQALLVLDASGQVVLEGTLP